TGYYLPAAVFGDVSPDHRLAQEEIFGPVQVVIPFDTEEEAVRIANGTPYGLIAGVWTRDGDRMLRLARRLRAGQVFLNNYGAGVVAIQADISQDAAVAEMAARAQAALGPIDVLVNNAGIGVAPKPLEELTETDFDHIFAVNVKSVYLTARHLVPAMKQAGRG